MTHRFSSARGAGVAGRVDVDVATAGPDQAGVGGRGRRPGPLVRAALLQRLGKLLLDELRHAHPDLLALLGAELDPAARPGWLPRLVELDLDRIELDALVGGERRARAGIGELSPLTLIFCRPSRLMASSTSFLVAASELVRASVRANRQAALSVVMVVMVLCPRNAEFSLLLAGSGTHASARSRCRVPCPTRCAGSAPNRQRSFALPARSRPVHDVHPALLAGVTLVGDARQYLAACRIGELGHEHHLAGRRDQRARATGADIGRADVEVDDPRLHPAGRRGRRRSRPGRRCFSAAPWRTLPGRPWPRST